MATLIPGHLRRAAPVDTCSIVFTCRCVSWIFACPRLRNDLSVSTACTLSPVLLSHWLSACCRIAPTRRSGLWSLLRRSVAARFITSLMTSTTDMPQLAPVYNECLLYSAYTRCKTNRGSSHNDLPFYLCKPPAPRGVFMSPVSVGR